MVYRNWLGLMRGDLQDTFDKGGKTMTRSLNPDRDFTAADGGALVLPGRSLMFVRNVGHLMTTDAILDSRWRRNSRGHHGRHVHRHDRPARPEQDGEPAQFAPGSVYIVKPKMHGPEEVAFTCDLFDRIEDAWAWRATP